MTDEKLPKLAEGSRWDEFHGAWCVVDDDETSLAASSANGKPTIVARYFGEALSAIYTQDTLAVIRRAGLDPLAIAAKELVQYRETSCEPLPGAVLDFIELAKALL